MNSLLNLKNFTLVILYIVYSFTLFGRWGVGIGALTAMFLFFGMPPVYTLETISRDAALSLFMYTIFIILWIVNGFFSGGLVESQIKHIEENGLWELNRRQVSKDEM